MCEATPRTVSQPLGSVLREGAQSGLFSLIDDGGREMVAPPGII
jgi:hypothetical protein